MGKLKYLYALTGNEGETLYESVPESVFDRYYRDEVEYMAESFKVGGDSRENFVERYLNDLRGYQNMKAIEEICGDEEPEKYFLEHEFPGETDDVRWEFADKECQFNWQDGSMFDHINQKDDIDTALGLGLIKYPPFDEEKKLYVSGNGNSIRAEVANKIRELTDTSNLIETTYHVMCGTDASKYDNVQVIQHDRAQALRKQASQLEREEVESMILIKGFYCNIHGGKAEYDKSVKKSEIIRCPACGHPICPVCANMYDKDPSTLEASREFMESCDSNSGMAYCGNCGDYSPEFMLGFLRLVGAPIPVEYENFKGVPRENVQFVATATVSALPDFSNIFKEVKEQWDKGITGIIKVQHSTGVIWGYTDRYPDKWVVTILYPDER